MFAVCRKYFVISVIAFLSLITPAIPAFATSYTLDSVADAGEYPGQGDYTQFIWSTPTSNGIFEVPSGTPHTSLDSASDIIAYADAHLPVGSTWSLKSAGDIWNGQGTIGTAVMLPAGTWRISVDSLSRAFSYDGYNWSEDAGKWLWFLNIRSLYINTLGQSVENYVTLGSSTRYDTEAAAFQASTDGYIDITLMDPGSLSFWIWDNNSIDNIGSITFDITAVPLPSTFLLLLAGLPLMLPRIRHLISR